MRGFRQLRCSEEAEDLVYDKAVHGARAGGDGYIARSGVGRTRARAAVITATPRAMRDNAQNHTLLGPVIDAMREA
jgi:hypothetical protein